MSEETPENMPMQKKNRKKRKNFLMNAKKYAKKGQMGRGTQIPDDLYQYFVGILEAMKKGIEDEEERASLVSNVLEKTKEQELNIIGNQLGCRVIELLLPYSSPEDLERFMEIVTPDLRKLCSDNFTSHVIETILKVACDRATEHLQDKEVEEPQQKRPKLEVKMEKKYPKAHRKTCHEFTIKICKYALNNLEDFVWDSYANHILRGAIKCLSGITLLPGEKPKINLFIIKNDTPKGIPPHETTIKYKNIPEDFKEIVLEFANRLSSWPQFKDLPFKNLTSALLQVLLYAVNNVDKKVTKNLVLRLLNESFAPEEWGDDVKPGDGDDLKENDEKGEFDVKGETNGDYQGDGSQYSPLPPVFKSESAVRLLEACLFVSKKKTYTQLYARCFINRLGQLAGKPMLNYTVQRLVDNCRVKEELEAMLSELNGSFDGILFSGNTGVLLALAKAALRLRAGQASFMNSLESALKCSTADQQKNFLLACLLLKPADRIDLQAVQKQLFIPVHGSVMLQTLLQFQRPGKALSGLLDLPAEELCRIFCDAKGCHVADACFTSPTVGAKSRDKLINKLKGFYQTLALDHYGSRAFEHIFDSTSMENKLKIMTEISEKSKLLNGTIYGKLIASKYLVDLFMKSQDNWKKAILKVGVKSDVVAASEVNENDE